MKQAAILTLFCAIACPLVAQIVGSSDSPVWEPVSLMKHDATAPAPTVPKEMIASVKVSDVTIPLEQETKLEDMHKRFGGTIGSEGDAGESLFWLCIHGNDSEGLWVLWLESGEIDGPYVGGFEWVRVQRGSRFDERCAALPNTSSVELPIGLRLGAPKAGVLQRLGEPTIRKGNVLGYEHEHQEIIRGEQFTSDNSVYVAIKDGVVWAINVWKTTSN